ncbi:MAG: hypothetical protein K6T85_19455 [Gorillibacterium sp.]|nr:hypothetical protein [Gorillibacterium sp.]
MPTEFNWISIVITGFIVLWTGAALFATIRPMYFWKITQGWKATKQPPKAYFVLSGIGTGICAIVGLTLLIYPLLQRL